MSTPCAVWGCFGGGSRVSQISLAQLHSSIRTRKAETWGENTPYKKFKTQGKTVSSSFTPLKTETTKVPPHRTIDAFRETSSSPRPDLCLVLWRILENIQRYQQSDCCSLSQKAVNGVTAAPLSCGGLFWGCFSFLPTFLPTLEIIKGKTPGIQYIWQYFSSQLSPLHEYCLFSGCKVFSNYH